jgi:hypothetical protein
LDVPQSGGVTVGADYDVDARTLVRLVRIGRDLRFIWRFALFSTLLWGAFVLTVERTTPEGSAQWHRVDADASPGFVALLVVAGVALLAHLALRLFGRAGKVAALIVPAVGPPAPTQAVSGADAVAGLLPALRRSAYVGFGMITAFLVITALVVAAAVGFWPAYEGNHGRGGNVVTIGQDATFTSHRQAVSGRGGGSSTVYRLHTSHGDADVAGDTPHDGQRWTLVSDPLGGDDSAYLVGGHAYLLDLVLGLAVLLLDVGIVFFGYVRVKAERRRRKQAGHVSLADSLSALAAGSRATLTVGTEQTGYKGRKIPPLTVVLGAHR